MELLIESIKMDWPVLLPILICSILVLAVVINKWAYFKKNKRDIAIYMRELNRELESNDLRAAQDTALRCGGVIGEVIEEAVRIFNEQKKGFSRAFDISATLATRKLESNLTILGTIGGVAPFLGLFGTVVLGVAIVAVIFFNLFQSVVKHFENDFNLIKLLFLNYVDAEGQSQSKYSPSPKVNL